MTLARIESCLRKLGINLGYYNGKEIGTRNIIERNKALFLQNNHFCLIWKCENVSPKQAINELKDKLY